MTPNVAVTPNVAAVLSMISHAEGTDRAPDPYRVCYGFPDLPGYHTIMDLSEHPAVDTATHPIEWKGESLASLGARYEHSISTAAGRYQLIKPTWLEAQGVLKLPDFTGPSQDDAAIWLIKERGALDLINSGNLAPAIGRLRDIWASLPGGTSGQPQRDFASLAAVYQASGGVLA